MKKQYYRKPHRIKRKKSIFKNRFFWLGLLVLIMAAGLFYFLIFSSFFEVKEIKISGNESVKKEEIENLIQKQIVTDFKFFKNKNINLVNLKEINKTILEDFPQIAKVLSKRDLPNTLIIEIEERKTVAVFKQNDNYFFVDKEGVIFEKTEEQSSQHFAIIQNLLLNKELKLGERMVEKEITYQILDFEFKMREDLKIPLKEMVIVSEERLNAKTSEGWDIYLNLKGDIIWQFTKLKTVLEKRVSPEKRGNLEYIDLRFERIYIFPET